MQSEFLLKIFEIKREVNSGTKGRKGKLIQMKKGNREGE